MKLFDDKETVSAIVGLVIMISVLLVFFVILGWMVASNVQARPLPSDRRASEDPNVKKHLANERKELVSGANKKNVIALGVNPVVH